VSQVANAHSGVLSKQADQLLVNVIHVRFCSC